MKKITCGKCRVSHRVEEKPHFAERSRCSDCKRSFWHCTKKFHERAVRTQPVIMGIEPERVSEWLA